MHALAAHRMIDERPWRVLYPAGFQEAPHLARTMTGALRATVAHAPTGTAMCYFDGALNLGELDALSDRLARHWRDAGVRSGDRIAIILQNVPQFGIATAAAWKLGAIAVPMNPMYRAFELDRLLGDCTPSAILCHDDHHAVVAQAVSKHGCQSILTTSAHAFQERDDRRVLPPKGDGRDDDLMVVLAAVEREAVPVHEAAPDDVALILYTSGTTGVPKGAVLSHRALVTNATFCRDWFPLSPASRIFGLAPLFHITGFVCHLCASFVSAAPLILTYRFAPDVALDAFREHRPTFTVGAITAFIALMQAPGATAADFASFDAVYSGGAPIPPVVIDQFAARFGKHIRSCYGMTETAAPTHFSPPDGAIPVDPKSGALAIGVPTPGTEAMVVSDNRRPLPIGEAGELVVRGSQVMAGYWGRPIDTAEVLVDGWMHTGDIAFRDRAGWFYLIDRKKDMIVASGFKVWPREVEDVLYAHPAVREAAVVGAPDAYRGETVVAFVSLKGEADAAALIAWCRARLAAYKAPRAVTLLDELPKTVSGKIMRAELRVSLQPFPKSEKEPR